MRWTLRISTIAVSGLLFILAWTYTVPKAALSEFVVKKSPPGRIVSPPEKHWVSAGETAEAHSASIALIADHTPVAVWYAGSEEGARDVSLYMSIFTDDAWSPPRLVMSRLGSQAALNRSIRKIGNPTLYAWPDGAIGVFYVTVSIGGWAASSINYIESPDKGATWSRPKRLVTSPFINISTLVRGTAVPLNDGSILLPVYHEFIGKFGEALRLNRDIEVLDKVRISSGGFSLQPTIAALDNNTALTLLRNAGHQPPGVLAAMSDDGGMSWSRVRHLTIPNPDSAIAALNMGRGYLLAALNDTEDGRHRLSLAIASVTDPYDFKVIKVLEYEDVDPASHEFQFSYPSMAMDAGGLIHLVYTWNRKRIRHWVFSEDWVLRDR